MVKTYLVLVLSLTAGAVAELIDEDNNDSSCPELHELQMKNQEMAGVLLGMCRKLLFTLCKVIKIMDQGSEFREVSKYIKNLMSVKKSVYLKKKIKSENMKLFTHGQSILQQSFLQMCC